MLWILKSWPCSLKISACSLECDGKVVYFRDFFLYPVTLVGG